jgi:transposase
MSMGRRKDRQEKLFIMAEGLPKSPGHPFYQALNRLLAQAGFDRWLEKRCQPYYEASGTRGRPSIPPGVYFRMLLVGYFENLSSQRAIAWRCHDSLSLREFLGIPLEEDTPDHSTLTNTRKRLDPEVFEEVFQFVLKLVSDHKLVSGQTVGVDSTLIEANAAMKTIVRRDSGEDWQHYVTRLMQEEGVIEKDQTPTAEEIRRYDKRRKGKKASNEDWKSPTDPDARIAKMKDGRTHLAYKAEHVVDLESEVILSAHIHSGDAGDAETIADSVMQAQMNLNELAARPQIEEVAADKGYHKAETLSLLSDLDLRTYVPEPSRPHRRKWKNKPAEQQQAVQANRRRVKRDKGKNLQRLRGERVERSFAHVCDSGGARRSWLRGIVDVSKRYLMAAAAHNLSRLVLKLWGIGKPRALQGLCALLYLLYLARLAIRKHTRLIWRHLQPVKAFAAQIAMAIRLAQNSYNSTDC